MESRISTRRSSLLGKFLERFYNDVSHDLSWPNRFGLKSLLNSQLQSEKSQRIIINDTCDPLSNQSGDAQHFTTITTLPNLTDPGHE